ncbi:uncharacterized protein [Triticum aestivum]|uniref:uncharacterized protein n=1 Tax=Triticum aestivum TaxID=4565 RepID=UPI001D01F37B|nr:uncharacterized protein LOC123158802 [Triticum aestivum]
MVGQGSITQSDLEYMLVDETTEPIAVPLSLLSEITDDFSLEIGSGGFSIVYKATLENGTIAVKKLSNTHMYEEEFHREVECLMKVKHKNIVRFLGYCADTQGNMKSHEGRLVMGDVQQRLLCFEYLPKGSLDAYIRDSSRELEWRECYQVIKGICEGLNYLHQENVLHLDLKPGNILLDEDMMPKITDFGLSRCLVENQTRLITKGVGGTLGYLAPEFESGEITHKFDLYSLGVIIIEMLTGKKGYQNIQDVLDIWKNTMVDPLQWEQIRVCARIGIECKEADPAKRPSSMKHIIDSLDETECRTHVNPAGGISELLLPHQFMLCFPFEPNKVITSPLHLTNNTDKHIAFRLIDKSMDPSFLSLPLYGIVPPKTPYTLVVTTQETEQQPRKHIIDVVLHSATLILGNELYYINAFQSRPDTYFQEMENEVQKVKLQALYTLARGIATSLSKPVSPTTKIICMVKVGSKYSLDTNEVKQWIVIGDDSGHVGLWDYQTQASITCVKFIARKQWIVAGTVNGNVHVYNYETMQKITSFKTGEFVSLVSLAVHPTQSYLLSVGTYMKLWDWDKGWECAQTFNSKHKFSRVAFNGNDTFATILMGDEDVKIWNLDSKESKYALYGHLYRVNCLDFFTCQDQEFLVTGSDDKTAKDPHRIYSCLPMPKRIIKIGCAGYVYHLACAMERVVIGKGNVVAVMDIDNVSYQEESTDHSKQQLSVDTRQHAGDTTSKEIAGSINKLLDVFPQKLRFPYHSNGPNPCSIHLTNNTDENVAFRLVDRSRKSPWWFAELPLYGIVPHRSTYTLIVTMKEEMKLKTEIDFDLVVQSTLVADKYEVFEDKSESDHFFVETKEFGKMVHEVTLKAVYLQYKEITSENTTLNLNHDPLCSLDSHPTELWILTGHDSGYACVWNNEMKAS